MLLLLLLSTSALAKHVYPKNLEQVEDGVVYQLANDYVFKEKAATFTLAAGTYVQRYQDAKAIYLIGPANCLQFNVVPPKNPAGAWTDTWDCGIFLPKDAGKGAAFFMIRKPHEEKYMGNGALIDAIIRAGHGSFDFPTSKHNDSLLRSTLTPQP
jgi:hypothetical protein